MRRIESPQRRKGFAPSSVGVHFRVARVLAGPHTFAPSSRANTEDPPMTDLSRRSLLRGAVVATGAAAVTSVTRGAGALADAVSHRERFGDIRDIKHVVILMQENRSFDHYFGSLRGVRGFADRATIVLPGGYPVWQQPDTAPGQPVTGTQYPWPLSAGTFSGAQPPTPEQGAQNYG